MSVVIDLAIPSPQQSRSLRTQQSFVEAGWAILRRQSWQSISISAIAKEAGRSVGVFYQRFGSKHDFLTVLLNRWLDLGYGALEHWPAIDAPKPFIHWYLRETFERISDNRYLWRAALERAIDQPEAWEPFRALAHKRRCAMADRLGLLRKRPLTQEERHRLDLANQVFNSVLNNALLNDPGPLRVDQTEFLPTLEHIFLTVAALDLH